METSRVSFIAAIGRKTRALGKDGDLIWKIPEDLQRFRLITSGHPVIMGRKTWDSLPDEVRPLPGRTNIVVTRSEGAALSGAETAHSIDEAIDIAKTAPGSEELFVIGGGELFRQALSRADRLYLTLVDDDADGDAFFPEYGEFTKVREKEKREGQPSYIFLTLER